MATIMDKLPLCYIIVDTLGTLARTIGQEHFQPLAQECVLLGMVRQLNIGCVSSL